MVVLYNGLLGLMEGLGFLYGYGFFVIFGLIIIGVWGGFMVDFFCMMILIWLCLLIYGKILLNIMKFSGFVICVVISLSVEILLVLNEKVFSNGIILM